MMVTEYGAECYLKLKQRNQPDENRGLVGLSGEIGESITWDVSGGVQNMYFRTYNAANAPVINRRPAGRPAQQRARFGECQRDVDVILKAYGSDRVPQARCRVVHCVGLRRCHFGRH